MKLFMTMKLITILILFFAGDLCESANIFAAIPNPFYSHQATFRPLWRELAKRGHKITLITTDLMEENENITQVDYSGAHKLMEDVKKMMIENLSYIKIFSRMFEIFDKIIQFQFQHPGLLELYEKNATFDVLIIEMPMPVWSSLSYKFKAPLIGVTSMEGQSILHGLVGNSIHPVLYPDFAWPAPKTFFERLSITSIFVFLTIFVQILSSTFGTNYARQYVAQDCPDLTLIEKNISLIFVNADPIFYAPRPSTPSTINLEGSIHLQEPKKLPKDLQAYLDQAKDGCIYFSLGSTVNSNALTPETIETFRKTFEEIAPIKILWKFENETLPNKPKNLEIRKWLPQQDILRHRNVKLFITQGGLQSMEEAIDSAVPMLGTPFYGDQIYNVNMMVKKKFGLQLDIKNLKQKELKETILELLTNPIYQKNIDTLSRIQKDKPMTSLEKAVWWTEYVIRHGGTEHLRSPSADIPLYQYFFLDIIAFVVFVLFVIVFVIIYIVKFIKLLFRKIFKRKSVDTKVKTN